MATPAENGPMAERVLILNIRNYRDQNTRRNRGNLLHLFVATKRKQNDAWTRVGLVGRKGRIPTPGVRSS
jgi:hypothetical protein